MIDFILRIEYNIKMEVFMDYLTAAETAEKWGISTKRIQFICKQGRIPGAFIIGNVVYYAIGIILANLMKTGK